MKCGWVCDALALHSRRFTVLCDWAVKHAREKFAFIDKTTFIGNGSQGEGTQAWLEITARLVCSSSVI